MIIGVNGRKNSGKDTIARMIQYHTSASFKNFIDIHNWLEVTQPFYTDNLEMTHVGSNYEIHKFAGKLKEMLSLLLGVSVAQLEDREYKESILPEQWWYYKGETGIFEYPNPYPANTKLPLIKPTVRDLMIKLGTDCGRDIIHPNIWINATLATYNPEYKWIITDLRFPNEHKALYLKNALLIKVIRPYVLDDYDPIDRMLDDHVMWHHTIINDGDIDHLYKQVVQLCNTFKL